jgi:hypothetical protein
VPATVLWTGAGDGSNWFNPDNWDAGALPGASDDVFINSSATVNHASGVTALHSLHSTGTVNYAGSLSLVDDSDVAGLFSINGTLDQLAGTFTSTTFGTVQGQLLAESGATIDLTQGSYELSSGTTWGGPGLFRIDGALLTVSTNANAPMNLELASGLLTGTANLTVSGHFRWTGGAMNGSGATVFAASANVDLAGDTKVLSQRTVNNSGSAVWTGGTLLLNDSARWNNLATAMFEIDASVAVDSTSGQDRGTFNNAGHFVLAGNEGTAVVFRSGALNNSGTVVVQAGTLQLLDSNSSSGSFTLGDHATLDLGGVNLFTFTPTSSLVGGTVRLSATTTGFDGVYHAIATVLTGGTTSFAALATTDTLELDAGTLDGLGNLTVTNQMRWSGGTMSGAGGVTTLGFGATGEISGSADKVLTARVFNNRGTVTWTGTGSLVLNGAAVWNNQVTATFDIRNDASVTGTPGTTAFDNSGVVRKSSGLGTSRILNPVFNNDGLVQVNTGTLSTEGGGNHSGQFTVSAGATLRVVGSENFTSDSTVGGEGIVDVARSPSGFVPVNFAGNYSVGQTSIEGVANFTSNATTTQLVLNATLEGNGRVTVTNLLTWTDGDMEGSGTTTVAASALVLISGSTTKSLFTGRTVNNGGAVAWSGTGALAINAGCVWNNLACATFDIETPGTVKSLGGLGVFYNAGLMRVPPGLIVSASLTNDGVVQVSGEISIGSNLTVTHNGSFIVAATGRLSLGGSSFTLSATSSVSGAGTVVFDGGNGGTVAGTYTAGRTLVNTSTVNFVAAATTSLEISGGTVNSYEIMTLSSLGVSAQPLNPGSYSCEGATTVATMGLDSRGTLTGGGELTVTDTLNWFGGTMTGTGTTTIGVGAHANLSVIACILSRRTLNNAGMLTVSPTSGLVLSDNATLNNLPTATLDLQSSAVNMQTATVNNFGTIRKPSGTGMAFLGGQLQGGVFNNNGLVQVNGGTLGLGAGGESAGRFEVAADATLYFNDSPNFASEPAVYNLTPASSVSGAGTVVFLAGFVAVEGAYSVGNTQISISAVRGVGATVSFDSDATTGTLLIDRGTLTGTGTVSVTASLNWLSGTMAGSGTTVVAAGATAALSTTSGGALLLSGRTFQNAGTATWATLSDSLMTLSDGATLINAAAAVFDIKNDEPIDSGDGGGTIVNLGTFRKSVGTNSTGVSSGVSFENDGTVQVQTGSLQLRGPGANNGTISLATGSTLDVRGDFTFTAGSSVTGAGDVSITRGMVRVDGQIAATGGTFIGPQAMVSGTGQILGPVINAGRLDVGDDVQPGTFTISGDYLQTSTGTLGVVLGGAGPGGPFSQLVVTGTATLAGVLNVSFLDGFTPQEGDNFTVLSYSTHAGSFDTLTAPPIDQLQLTAQYGTTSLTLVTVSIPG